MSRFTRVMPEVILTIDERFSHFGRSLDATLGDANTSNFQNNNDAIYVPMWIPQNVVVTHILWANQTTTGNGDGGIYDASFSRLVSTGSVARSAGVQEEAVTNTKLKAGQYWFALACASSAGTFQGQTGWGTSALARYDLLYQASAFALPATATPTSVPSNFIDLPIFGVKIA